MNKKLAITALAVFLLIVGILVYRNFSSMGKIRNYEECIQSPGSSMPDISPAQCITADGKVFIDESSFNSGSSDSTSWVPGLPVPEGVEAARRDLSKKLEIEEGSILILEALEEEWPDSCLGLAAENEVCSQVITPGYKILLKIDLEEYRYRTNKDGSLVKLESIKSSKTPEVSI